MGCSALTASEGRTADVLPGELQGHGGAALLRIRSFGQRAEVSKGWENRSSALAVSCLHEQCSSCTHQFIEAGVVPCARHCLTAKVQHHHLPTPKESMDLGMRVTSLAKCLPQRKIKIKRI